MSALPTGFEAFDPYTEKWSLGDAAGRAALRSSSTAAERRALYDAVTPLLADALDALDARPIADHDATERRLMNLLLSFAHVSLAVELQGPDEEKHAPYRDQMRITRAPADNGAAA